MQRWPPPKKIDSAQRQNIKIVAIMKLKNIEWNEMKTSGIMV